MLDYNHHRRRRLLFCQILYCLAVATKLACVITHHKMILYYEGVELYKKVA